MQVNFDEREFYYVWRNWWKLWVRTREEIREWGKGNFVITRSISFGPATYVILREHKQA